MSFVVSCNGQNWKSLVTAREVHLSQARRNVHIKTYLSYDCYDYLKSFNKKILFFFHNNHKKDGLLLLERITRNSTNTVGHIMLQYVAFLRKTIPWC